MGIVAAYAVPHPPLIVESVGKGERDRISATVSAMDEVFRRVAAHRPDAVVIVSPHAPMYRDGFFISDAIEEIGTMAQFGAPDEQLGVLSDLPFAVRLSELLDDRRIPTAGRGETKGVLDHASFIPLYFLKSTMPLDEVRVVRLGISGLPAADHEFVGEAVARTADEQGKRTVLIASGDWSHKLKEDGPYGFAPEGPEFDEALARVFENGTLSDLLRFDEALCEGAAECGLRAFQVMAGALRGRAFSSDLLSYEGPFGVGYGVVACEVLDGPSSSEAEVAEEIERTDVRRARQEEVSERCGEDADGPDSSKAAASAARTPKGIDAEDDGVYAALLEEGEDPLAALARLTVETFVASRRTVRHPDGVPEKYLRRRAGVFVSLHIGDELRGCIGTIFPVRSCIADEVIRNAVAAACEDPRFMPVMAHELPHLTYSVDVLEAPEPVTSLEQLDPRIYGIIVSCKGRRGLLLPDLEGVDTVEDQLEIAKRKAGIATDEDVKIERFEVVRHAQRTRR